jgi:hypothetical protein
MRGIIPPLPLYVFMESCLNTGTTLLYFTLLYSFLWKAENKKTVDEDVKLFYTDRL